MTLNVLLPFCTAYLYEVELLTLSITNQNIKQLEISLKNYLSCKI